MGFTISADDPRTIRAIELAAEADQWLEWHTDDGQRAYGVPSQTQPDLHYLVTSASCDCPDFRRSLDGEHGEPRACKHILAVRLFMELVKAQLNVAPRGRATHPSAR